MKRLLLAAVLLLCVTLCGCTPMETNLESLMQPPKLTDLQVQVDNALREAVGQNFSLKYPRNGEHRSAFSFLDLNADGTDEALAFFSTTDNAIQIAMLRQTATGWQVFDIMPGLSFCTEIDFVQLQQLGDMPWLLVGWGGTGMANNVLAVYSLDEAAGQQGALSFSSRWDYSQLTVTDLDRNGQDELLLMVAADSYNSDIEQPSAQLVGVVENNVVNLISEVLLASNITKFYPPVSGSLTTDSYGAVVDCQLATDKLCTVLLSYQDGLLVQLFADEGEKSLYRQTVRTQKVFSDDINGDGVVEIPVERLAEGYEGTRETPAYLTDYSNLIDGKLETVQTAYVNLSRGYRLLLPARWDGHPISVLVHPDSNEAIFFLNTTGNLYDHSKELLRIQVYSTLDSHDKLSAGRYFQLAAKGSHLYTAALPIQHVTELALTKNEVVELFSLIS